MTDVVCAVCRNPSADTDLHPIATMFPDEDTYTTRLACRDTYRCMQRAQKLRRSQPRVTPTPKPKAPALVSVSCTVCGAVEELPVVRGLRSPLPARWAFVTVAEAGQRVSSVVLCVGCSGRVLVVLRRRAPVPAGHDTW